MDFRILGPLEVLDKGLPLALGGSKQRALLGVLLVHANEALSTDRLIDELWGEHPPATSAKSLQVRVSRLRKALGTGSEGLLVTRDHGYELRLDPECVDAHRFERLVAEGRRDLVAGRPERARPALEAALSLWCGAPLADLAYEGFAQGEIGRLENLRAEALEQLNDAKLALGCHAEVVGELEALIGEHPYRESLRSQLMLALYRCDRQAEALQAYQDARRVLVEGLAIEPGERLRELERAILAQDPALAPTTVEAAEAPVSRLPLLPNRTLGRDQDLEAVSELLRGHARLVTLTGPGGVGKTRLALEVAGGIEPELPDGAWFVSLAATAHAGHVPSAIAQAMGITPREGERPEHVLKRFLAPRRGLLVLDNLEHVLSAAPWINDLLGACPATKVLATSREALLLQAEHRYEVSPLNVPTEGRLDAVDQSPAGALFVERARGRDPAFELNPDNAGAITEICRRLDGLPLAIELAAARTSVLGPEQLNARLAETLDVLSSGWRDLPDRQRTLRATIEWSHRLLGPAEAEAFGRFGVFAGGATIEAAEEVTGADLDTLSGLVDKHLLLRVRGPGGDSRLLMLETVREYASERLQADEDAVEVHRRHCRHYHALAERVEPELFTHGEAEWLPRLDAEVDNLRAALDWSLLHDPVQALDLVGSLFTFWAVRNRFGEGLERVQAALDAAGDDAPARSRAKALAGQAFLVVDAGSIHDVEGSVKRGRAYASEALALFRQIEDVRGAGHALVALAWFEQGEGFPQHRRLALADEALACAREAGDTRLAAMALSERALALPPEQAEADLEGAAQALREVGDVWGLVTLYWNAAHNAIRVGSPERAAPSLDLALALARELEDPSDLMFEPGTLGLYALFVGDLDRAQDAFEEQLRFCRERADPHHAAGGLGGLAAIAARQERDERAANLLGAATAIGPIEDPDVVAQLDDRFFTPARARHGERRWDEARATGARLAFEEAIALALTPI